MIAVPYHLGKRGVEVGEGPLRIVEALGCDAVFIESDDGVAGVNRRLTDCVAMAKKPAIILAGNCNSCIGTLAALENPGIVWFDAHGDFNTPETTVSGAFEGMSLAVATGHCHREMMATPVREENVVLAATRSFDALEAQRLERSKIKIVSIDAVQHAVDALPCKDIYLHIDLDVLDPSISPGVNFSEPGGILPEQLFNAVRHVIATKKLAAAAISNFRPSLDKEQKTLKIACELVAILTS